MDLGNLREQIDQIDKELITLISQRLGLVKSIGELKLKSNTSIYRPQREKEIIQKLDDFVKSSTLKNIDKQIIEAIFYEIFAISRNIEMPQKVAYLGPLGSYTHQAAEDRFGPLSSYTALNNISSIFECLINKNAKYGVIPIENNTNGMVGESIDNLAKYDLKVVSEIILPIHFSFASINENLGDIKRIYSKDIAFGQCRKFLHDYGLQNIEQICVSSTSNAAKLASEDKNGAALCSKIAAKLYKIPILFENVELNKNNKTRFFIISDFYNEHCDNSKTSAFITADNTAQSGVLFNILKDFKDNGINLTKIDSRPISKYGGFEFGFYVDFYGHRFDRNVDNLFKKLKNELKWLGSYPEHN